MLMKNILIGGAVAGLLLFLWQTLSWAVMDLHAKEYQATPAEDTLLASLAAHLTPGQYMLPRAPQNASWEEVEKKQAEMTGKPWAVINYHKSFDTNMPKNMIRGLLSCMIAMTLVCWIFSQYKQPSFSKLLISSNCIGLAGYLFIPYSLNIWYETPDATTNLMDTVVGWGMAGAWLGWWVPRNSVKNQ